MNPVFIERLRAADLTGPILLNIFDHLETIMKESKSGQSALTLGYVSPDDDIKEGDFVPTINIVLTQYQRPE
jgi:hypothetical protein